MLGRVPALAATLVAGVLLTAPAALAREPSTKVVAFKSIAGVSLGSSPAEVRRELGGPTTTIRVGHRIAQFEYDRIDLVVGFETDAAGDPADDIAGDDARYRTSKGIHPGSSITAMKRAYPGVRCNVGDCSLYRGEPGAFHTRTLSFDSLLRHKVTSVQVTEIFVH